MCDEIRYGRGLRQSNAALECFRGCFTYQAILAEKVMSRLLLDVTFGLPKPYRPRYSRHPRDRDRRWGG
jgi:hypothetical protein